MGPDPPGGRRGRGGRSEGRTGGEAPASRPPRDPGRSPIRAAPQREGWFGAGSIRTATALIRLDQCRTASSSPGINRFEVWISAVGDGWLERGRSAASTDRVAGQRGLA